MVRHKEEHQVNIRVWHCLEDITDLLLLKIFERVFVLFCYLFGVVSLALWTKKFLIKEDMLTKDKLKEKIDSFTFWLVILKREKSNILP